MAAPAPRRTSTPKSFRVGRVQGYTHLNKLQEHFYRATESELAPIVDAITQRAKQIGSNSKEQVENE